MRLRNILLTGRISIETNVPLEMIFSSDITPTTNHLEKNDICTSPASRILNEIRGAIRDHPTPERLERPDSYTGAFGDEPRNFEPWSSDVDDTDTSPLLTTPPHQREDVSALDRFSVHRCPIQRLFSGTVLELVARPNYEDKDISGLDESSKNIIDTDADGGKEINNAAPVPTSYEIRNIMKSMRSYSDVHYNGERNNNLDDIEQFVDNFMMKKTTRRKTSDYFPKAQ
ncbi:uncharacterized protein TNCV_2376721 [Trichonephila clavipes]|nr:uncharacterized protein TNCV_2376721 [Trichonephila clavipes]